MPQSNKEKEKAQKLLESFGKTIDKQELQKFEDKGFSVSKAQNYAQKQGGVSLGDNARAYVKTGGASGNQSIYGQQFDQVFNNGGGGGAGPGPWSGGYTYPGGGGGGNGGGGGGGGVGNGTQTMSQDTYDYEAAAGLINLRGDIDKQLEVLRGASAENIAGISAGAQKYGYDADERARKYVADRAGQSAEAVENIRAKGNLDLQAIVNAGLKDVETIRGQFGVEQEKTRGEFGVKQEETRQAGSRDVARIAGKAGIYQGLMGAFSF
jgi:hypothetical protein